MFGWRRRANWMQEQICQVPNAKIDFRICAVTPWNHAEAKMMEMRQACSVGAVNSTISAATNKQSNAQ